MASVQEQVGDFIRNSSGAVSVQKIINSTPGDYDDVGLAVRNTVNRIRLGRESFDPDNIEYELPSASIPSSVQRQLGQDPTDTDIDDLDDAFKAFGPSNFSIGGVLPKFKPDNFEGSLPGPELPNDTMDVDSAKGTMQTIKSVIDENSSVIIVAFFVLGAIGVSLGPLDFE